MSALPAEARLANEAFLWAVEQIFGPPADAADQTGGPPASSADQAGRAGAAATLEGIPASAGSYTGAARIIRGESEFDRLQPGDVLVCPATCPVWSVLFASIGALVADFGGTLSHQAIIAASTPSRRWSTPATAPRG
jgi:pyruvate,water dikinase